jgi:hypothetical protein
MNRLLRAALGLIGVTLLAGLAGGLVGLGLGWLAPGFVTWIHSPAPFGPQPPDFDAARFGLGLGTVCGLVLGTGAGLLLAITQMVVDALAAGRVARPPGEPPVR